jgi:AcrR family transcriptional regulator
MGVIRDATRTKRKILDAAREEFAAHGLDGCRVEAIAKRAVVKKQLIFHYFRNKRALYNEVMEETFRRRELWQMPNDATRMFRERFAFADSDHLWLRVLIWEAIQYRAGRAVRWRGRRLATIRNQQDSIRSYQKHGKLKRSLAPELIQLAMFALANYPLVFPQITKLAVGVEASSPAFKRKWSAFLDTLGAELARN